MVLLTEQEGDRKILKRGYPVWIKSVNERAEYDVALLPLGPGCQTMYDMEVVNVLQVIEPAYFVPIHFTEGNNDVFCSRYKRSIVAVTECEVCNLDHYTSHTFETT